MDEINEKIMELNDILINMETFNSKEIVLAVYELDADMLLGE